MAVSACGFLGIVWATQELWKWSMAILTIGALLDAMDGFVARKLKAESRIGMELDSLSDFMCFGCASIFLMYEWSLKKLVIAGIPVGLAVAIIFCMCVLYRLARFNSETNTELSSPYYFTGIPSPGGAGLMLTPLILSFVFGDRVLREPWFTAPYIILIGGLVVSRLPTITIKKASKRLLFTILAACMVAWACFGVWLMLGLVGIVYFFTIPVFIVYAKLKYRSTQNSTS